jgi:outer membrane protein TolC
MSKRSRVSCFAGVLALLAAAPACAQEQAPYKLTLQDAIQRGLRANLRVLVSGARVQEAQATRDRRLANLLPRARTEFSANLQNRNLSAFGITLPGAPEVVGPFSNYDLRLYVDQPLFDRVSVHGLKAATQQEEAARKDLQDTRDDIVRLVAAFYLNAQAAAARVEAANSRVTTAEALVKLARDQRQAGVATGVDVLRAEVALANEQQGRLAARNSAQKALLALARNIGMGLATPLELAEPLRFSPVDQPSVPEALPAAFSGRSDYLSLATQRQALVEQQKASQARFWPRVGIAGNYGGLGRNLGDLKGTGILQGTISLTVFDRDREAEQKEIESRIRRLDRQMADLRAGIEEDIREALLTLESSAEEVRVAQAALELAQRELRLTRDRFQEGVTNNVEVITAQDSLARAMDNHIIALTRYADAKMALARALGSTEHNYSRFLGNP